MNKQLITKLLYRLSVAYSAARTSDPEAMSDLWLEILSEFTDEVVKDSVDMLIKTAKWFPSLNEVIVACNQLNAARVQALQNEHAELKFAEVYNEKRWLEIIAGYEWYGGQSLVESARQDMVRAKNARPKTEMSEEMRIEIERLVKKMTMKGGNDE